VIEHLNFNKNNPPQLFNYDYVAPDDLPPITFISDNGIDFVTHEVNQRELGFVMIRLDKFFKRNQLFKNHEIQRMLNILEKLTNSIQKLNNEQHLATSAM